MNMALIKQEVTQELSATIPGAVIEHAVEALGVNIDAVVIEESTVIYDLATANIHTAIATVSTNTGALAALEDRGFAGLAFDWTSFPSISLKSEGHFEDFDGQKYGSEFNCYLRGSKERYVYRANPVQDNKRDVAFSYDRVATQNGILLADKKKEWLAQGKIIEEKLYLEVMVEMNAPGEIFDGEYRILSVSPTSKGRFTGHAAKCAAAGNGDPGAVVTKVLVGEKITKVANPFYPWAFELVK
jgi:hypothetical protein